VPAAMRFAMIAALSDNVRAGMGSADGGRSGGPALAVTPCIPSRNCAAVAAWPLPAGALAPRRCNAIMLLLGVRALAVPAAMAAVDEMRRPNAR